MLWVASKRLSTVCTNNIEEDIRDGTALSSSVKKALAYSSNDDRVVLSAMILMNGRLSERSSESIAEKIRRGAELSNAIRQAM